MPNVLELINILDTRLKNNDKHLINHILSYLKCKCDICNEQYYADNGNKIYCIDDMCENANKNVYYCDNCSFIWCPDACNKCYLNE